MNEQLQAKLLEYLNSGEAFVREQAPEYVNQALTFYAWDAAFDLRVCLCFAIVGFLLLVSGLILSRDYNSEGTAMVFSIFGLLALIFGLIGSTVDYSNLKKIELAPKVFLVEKLLPGKCGK